MFRVLDYVSDDLPPTRTYGRRSFCWLPVDEAHPAYDGRLGDLIIKLQHARSGVHRNIEVDRYAVERDTPEPGDNGGAAFWLLNELDPKAAEPYRCVIGGLNPLPQCGCKAGKCKVPGEPDVTEGCKHRDCLLWLIQHGFIEGQHEYGIDNTGAGRNGNRTSTHPGQPRRADSAATHRVLQPGL